MPPAEYSAAAQVLEPAAPANRVAELERELRQARAEAAAAQRHLRALTDHLREGLLLLDAAYRVQLVNQQLCELLNLARPASQWVGVSLRRLTAQVRTQMADPLAYDANIKHLLGHLTAGEASSSQLMLHSGHILERDVLRVDLDGEHGWLFRYRDITDRVQAERQRDEQRQFYETILDELPVEVVVLDENFRYVYANPQAVPDPEHRAWLLDGHTVGEFCARHGFPLSLAEHRYHMFREAQVSSEPVFWDDHTPLPAGELVHQRHFKLLSRAGQPGQPYMLGCGLDVTARVQAEARSQRSEAALREQQAFMEQVFDTTPSAIFVRNAAGRLVFSNFMMAQLTIQLGRSATVALGHPWQAADDARVLTAGEELASEDGLTLPSGEVRWFHTTRRLLERPDGTRQVLGVSTDITALKAAQLAAEEAAQARENFLANVSHEIRTPMNGVLGMAALLAKTDLTAQQQDYLRTIRSSGTHLLGLLNDVLDVAKIRADKLELEQVPFELLDSVAQAVAPLALQAQEKGLTFQFERLPRAAAWVQSDPFRLNQIIINLLSNAIKFTDSGHVTLRTSLVAEQPAQLLVRFEVQDTGVGIRPEALARVFESFTQAHADTSRRYGGTGLGLTISRALVAQLGGELRVASEPGRGSTFAFTLPLSAAAAPTAPPSETCPNPDRLRGTRMLLAEDNEVNRTVAGLHLLHWGVAVDEAPDGLAALRLLEQRTYDVVLMDVQMPGLSGLEVTRRLRQHPNPARAATPVLALTANVLRRDSEQYLAAGFSDYLAKPFTEDALYGKLVSLLPPADEAPAPTPPYDLGHLRHEAKGQPAFIARMIQAFLNSTPPALGELQAAAAAHNWPRVAELAHYLKPNVQLLAIEAAIGPVLTLETPPTPATEPLHHAAVIRLAAALEAVLQALPDELSEQ